MCDEVNLNNTNTPKEESLDKQLEKQKKLEEMQLRVKKLREERIAKHTARIEMLKKINMEKYWDKSKPSFNTSITSNSLSKPLLTSKPNTQLNNQTKVKINLKSDPAPIVIANKYSNVQTKVDCRRSVVPKSATSNATTNSILAVNHKPKNSMSALNHKPINTISTLNHKPNSSVSSLSHKSNNSISALNHKPINPISTLNQKPKNSTSNLNHNKPNNTVSGVNHKTVSNISKHVGNQTLKSTTSSVSTEMKRPKISFNKIPSISSNTKMSALNNSSSTYNRLSKITDKSVVAVDNKKPPTFSLVKSRFLNKPEHKDIPKSQMQKKGIIKSVKNQKDSRKTLHDITSSAVEKKPDFKEKSHMRGSLSTVHFKRMGSDAAQKCMRRSFSVGNMKQNEIDEELSKIFPVKQYTLPVESERKKSVKFLTPLRKSNTPTLFLNTPKPSELKSRLNDWLHRRGKSLSSYHHLHCFGIHNGNNSQHQYVDEENKENEEVYNDDSFEELTTDTVKDNAAEWRRASYTLVDSPIVDSGDQVPTVGAAEEKYPSNDNATGLGALEDLHQLIMEGYSWQRCAEWLDAIARHCGDDITKSAAYWECRAALEDKRGDFPKAIECYNKAILQGAQPAEVEESLDNLLQKFMELNLEADSKNSHVPDPKFLDVKNVFKSTLIRFAIQQKNIAESKQCSGNLINKYVATPVRRSSRLSHRPESIKVEKTPNPVANGVLTEKHKEECVTKSASKSTGRKQLVQLTSTLQNVDGQIRNNMVFVPNKALNFNDL